MLSIIYAGLVLPKKDGTTSPPGAQGPPGPAGPSLTVKEQDGTPTVANVNTIKVTNGKLTDDGGGVVSLDLSGGGGGGITQLTGPVTAGPGSGSQVTTITPVGVTPGTYGDANDSAQVTVNAAGQVTAAANVAINTAVKFPVYFGMADADLYTPDNLGSLSTNDIATFLGTLSSRGLAGPEAGGTKYRCQNLPAAARCFFWFIYPDHFGDINSSTGFQWAGGNVGAPTEVVKKFEMQVQAPFTGKHLVSVNGLTDFATLGLAGNGFGNSFGDFNSVAVDGNGWAYTRLRVGDVYYRFYPFATWILEPAAAPFSNNSVTSQRVSNYTTIAYDPPVGAAPSPFNAGWVQVVGLSDTSFNVTQWAQDDETFFNLVYFNAGADVPNAGDVGGSFPQSVPGFVCNWFHGTGNTLTGHFPNTIDFAFTEVSLFVTFDSGTGYDYTTLQVENADVSVVAHAVNRLTVPTGALVADGEGHVTISFSVLDFYVDYPEAKAYVMRLVSTMTGTITQLDIKSSSGTCNAAVNINATPVTGLSAVAVSSVLNTAAASGANVIALGDSISLVLSALAFPRDVTLTLTIIP